MPLGEFSWVVGVGLAACASIISNLGLNLQKLSHIRNANAEERIRKSYLRQRLWVAGLSLIILGSFADFTALGFGAQSIIAPLGSMTLVANVVFAQVLLKEPLNRRELIATLVIVAGSAVAVAFASHQDTTYDIDQLFGFYTNARFGIYGIAIVSVMTAMWFAIQFMENKHIRHGETEPYLRYQKYHRFCYAALSGIVGAQSVLFAKCCAELMVNTVSGKGIMFAYWQTYVVLACMATTIVLQIKWLNQGLKQFDALYIVPVFQTFWILVSVVSGLIFFGEYQNMSVLSAIMFPVGVFLTIGGVFFLSQRSIDRKASESDPVDVCSPLLDNGKPGSPTGTVSSYGSYAHRHTSRSASNSARTTTSTLGSSAGSPVSRGRAVSIDPTIGFQGSGPPAALTPSMMGRCSVVYTHVRSFPDSEYEDHSQDRPLLHAASEQHSSDISGSNFSVPAGSGGDTVLARTEREQIQQQQQQRRTRRDDPSVTASDPHTSHRPRRVSDVDAVAPFMPVLSLQPLLGLGGSDGDSPTGSDLADADRSGTRRSSDRGDADNEDEDSLGHCAAEPAPHSAQQQQGPAPPSAGHHAAGHAPLTASHSAHGSVQMTVNETEAEVELGDSDQDDGSADNDSDQLV